MRTDRDKFRQRAEKIRSERQIGTTVHQAGQQDGSIFGKRLSLRCTYSGIEIVMYGPRGGRLGHIVVDEQLLSNAIEDLPGLGGVK